MMKTTLYTKGMHCKSCEQLVVDSLEEAGATHVEANYSSGIISLEHADSLTLDRIKKIIQEEGYEVLK